jgi:hypothetical protein
MATINLNGKEMLVKEKDKVEEYVVLKIMAETIFIIYKGKKVPVNKNL